MKNRRLQFDALEPRPGVVVFLGDSITESGAWDEWFPKTATSNRGIAGERIRHVAARLDSSLYAPAIVCLMIGTNDVPIMRKVQHAAREYEGLVRGIRERAPGSPLVVTGVLPREPRFAAAIVELNAQIAGIAQRAGRSDYIDMMDVLAGSDGGIKPGFSEDQLHLNGLGYVAWVDRLRPYIREHGRRARSS